MLLWKKSCFDKKCVSQWLVLWRWKKVLWQNWMDENFNVQKMYITIERMDGCEYSIEIFIVPFKELIAGINLFLEINILLLKKWKPWKKKYLKITQTMANRKFSRQNKHSTVQTMNDCHSFCDKNRYPTSKDIWLQLECYPFKNLTPKIGLPKE